MALDTLIFQGVTSSTSPKSFLQKSTMKFTFSGPFASLKLHLTNLFQAAFFDAQDGENEFALDFNTLKHLFVDFT
jgi:hypothetical protein